MLHAVVQYLGRFDSEPVSVGFVVYQVALAQIFVPALRFSFKTAMLFRKSEALVTKSLRLLRDLGFPQ
jgi:hypothetical protein